MPGPARPVIGVLKDARPATDIPVAGDRTRRLTLREMISCGRWEPSGLLFRAPALRLADNTLVINAAGHTDVVDCRIVYQALTDVLCRARNVRTPSTA